ncbi:hypothetical protein, conserved [Trypanosoma brucei brucei TREU927]|uniref:Nudix hydrolase domain-containing protein n=1 Tax=Trypanosoma brucei brucei (strain 927/4 GUTat10.1) TaxID=185431 RepID=Q584Y4_TRYB2|nr:hypothetical protein, conserved [Trypanosoma brucei brucei TREU927]AAX79938.1 hypothetical protein, conserved [Trypanosoma brucei]AAZ11903.1 hypothetical protein, conserved [Trypanosoma brucei brucei TREU927]
MSKSAIYGFETIFLAFNASADCAGDPYPPSRVEVTVDDSFGRLEGLAEEHSIIEETWRKLMKGLERKILHNGLKFRLHNVVQYDNGKCHLQLGITDYKSSMGVATNVDYFLRSTSDGGTDRRKYLARALGIECFTTTSDEKAVMFCRSSLVSEYPGYYCFPGGHPEPQDILCQLPLSGPATGNHNNIDHNHNSVQNSDLLNDRLRREEAVSQLSGVNPEVIVQHLFDSAVMEVADELGVERTACRNRGLLSIVENMKNMKPDACFWVEVNQTAAEVQARFDSRVGFDAFESVPHSLVVVHLDDIVDCEGAELFIKDCLGGKVTPPSVACWLHGMACYRSLRGTLGKAQTHSFA